MEPPQPKRRRLDTDYTYALGLLQYWIDIFPLLTIILMLAKVAHLPMDKVAVFLIGKMGCVLAISVKLFDFALGMVFHSCHCSLNHTHKESCKLGYLKEPGQWHFWAAIGLTVAWSLTRSMPCF